MEEKIQTNIICQTPIDELKSINKIEGKENKNTLIRPCLEAPKERKSLFVLTKERQTSEQKDKMFKPLIQSKRQIDLSPFQFHFPLTLSQNIENKGKESNPKDTKENSDFEIDVMTESWGLNKLEKMEKELDGDSENDKLKIELDNKSKDKENDIEEINIANDENDEDISISKNSVIDITEMRGSDIDKEEHTNNKDKDYSLSESVQNYYTKSRYLRGHCPFNFFEKEKCKNVDFKKVNVRSYISAISAQWKIMTDEEKEPYVKLSEEFKRKILESNNLEELEELKMTNKKRKRKLRILNKTNKDNNKINLGNKKEEPKIINNNINFNNNKIENFSVYTTNRYTKKKADRIMNEVNSNENKSIENKSIENETSSYIQQTLDKSENDKKDNNIINSLCDKYKIIKQSSKIKTNEYIKSVLIPFVAKSLEFLDSIRSDNINEEI